MSERTDTMQIPTWEQFFAVFAAPDDEQAHAVRAAFIQQYNEREGDQATSSVDDYVNALITSYGYFLDFKESTFGVVEWLEEKLGSAFTADFDDGGDTVKVRFAGKEIVQSYHHVGDDEFEQDLAQLERLFGNQYVFVYRYLGEGCFSDTLELLLVYTSDWRRAETVYGQLRVAAYFRRCVSNAPSPVTNDAPSVSVGTPSSASQGQASAASRFANEEESEWGTFYRFRAKMFLWFILPVLVLFALSVGWGVLKGNTLQPLQSKGCENVDKTFRNLPAEQADPLKEHMRQQLGCSSK